MNLFLETHNKLTKPKPKPTFIFKNYSRVCVSLCTTVVAYITQHRAVLIIVRLIFETIVIAQMMSTGLEDERYRLSIYVRYAMLTR